MAESKSVFDAVNSALEELTPGVSNAATTTNEDPPASNPYADAADAAEDQDTELGVAEAGDEVGEEGGKTETGDGEDAGEDEGAAGKPDGADGKPADGKGDTDEAKAAAEAAAAAAAKKPDALNDPVPKDVAPATQERIRTLIKATKEAETQRAEATQNLDFIVNGVKGAGMSPAQFGETLSFMSVYNSGNFEKAIEMLEPFLDNMYALAGKERPAHDPLKGFPDLAEAVRVGHMTRQWASQLAASRRQQQTRSTIETSQRTAQEQETAADRGSGEGAQRNERVGNRYGRQGPAIRGKEGRDSQAVKVNHQTPSALAVVGSISGSVQKRPCESRRCARTVA